ncbi:MAG: M20/M25/M40 family metallo-hydrolase [Candidatus Marinimicrobia bacterium]|nr:M20/M25/M40 family metallo-hydrolase [Candidatus Neomarinimicrobiota bacterium]
MFFFSANESKSFTSLAEAWIETEGKLPLQLKFLIEGEEETGSASLDKFIEENKDRLACDVAVISDTSQFGPGQPAITYGLRGIAYYELRLTGPKQDLHSGTFGGAVANPANVLVSMLASLVNERGQVQLPGFYDDVVEPHDWEREELTRLGSNLREYADFLGIQEFFTVEGYSPFEATRFAPTIDFNGIGGGYQGEGSKTVIPSTAFVKISCRLVPDQKPEKIQQLLSRTLEERCPSQVEIDIAPGHCGSPYMVVPPGKENTPTDQSPALNQAFRSAHHCIHKAFGKPPVYLREGGSVPIIADLKRVAGLDSLMIGMFTTQDNLHAPDESVHIGMLEKGVEASAGILSDLAGV